MSFLRTNDFINSVMESGLPGAAKHVAHVLDYHVDDNGICRLSISDISRLTGYSDKKTISKALTHLEGETELTVIRSAGRNNEYQIPPSNLLTAEEETVSFSESFDDLISSIKNMIEDNEEGQTIKAGSLSGLNYQDNENDHTYVSHEILDDERLDLDERGFLLTALSIQEYGQISKARMVTDPILTRPDSSSHRKKLMELGYLVYNPASEAFFVAENPRMAEMFLNMLQIVGREV